ncbi:MULTISPECIES: hypothetical protein [unclassified Shewanella]|uniref:hypothetical protein n=1 Tax=unclassified Shewanella TaxID=196818 RepID=UPI00354BA6BC
MSLDQSNTSAVCILATSLIDVVKSDIIFNVTSVFTVGTIVVDYVEAFDTNNFLLRRVKDS